ncbi:MAG: histidine triad nucleotide-binding protein [Puniceicoccales bacterium]|jgi:histidine triad (HIT) family protein|nr:histidine triad nucleotide-binding protein [Puniceicoccales bacterium]
MGTLFEKIAAGEIPAEFLYRDGKCFVIRDIAPQAPLHLLIIPQKPIRSLADAENGDCELLGHLLLIAKRMADKYAPGGDFRLVANSGESAGQSVPHLHLHLLAGRSLAWPPG